MRISGWAKLSDGAAFLRQNQIQIGIEQCHRDLAGCTDRFTVRRPYSTRKSHISIFGFLSLQVASSMVQSSENERRRREQQHNHMELMDTIAQLREEVRRLRTIPSQVSQSHDQLLPVSLAWLYCVDT